MLKIAKKIKGIVIEIGGDTKPLTKAMSEADKEIKSTQQELKEIHKALKFNPDNVDLLKQKEQALNDIIAETKQKLDTMRSAQAEVERQFKNGELGAEEYRKFQRELIETESKLGHYTKQLKDTEKETKRSEKEAKSLRTQFGHFKDRVKDTARQIPGLNKVIDKMDDKMKDSEKHTKKLDGALGGIAKVAKGMGKAVGVGIAAVGAGLVAASAAIAKGVQAASEYGDMVGDEAQKLRMTTAEYQELSYAAEICGTNMNTLKKAQKTLAQKYPDLSMTEALKKCADSADVAGTATDMFGAKAAQELLPMLNEGSAGIEEMTKKAHEMGMVMSDESISAADRFQDTLAGLKNTISTITNTLMSSMLPGLTSVMEGLQGLMVGADGAKDKITAGAKEMINSISDVLPRFMDIIGGVLDALLEIAPKIISELLSKLIELLPSLIGHIQSILQAVITAITENAPLLANALVELINMLVDFLVTNVAPLLDAVLQIIIIVAQSLAPALPHILVAVIECAMQVIELLLDNVDLLIDCVLRIIISVASALPKLATKIFEKIPGIIVKVVSAVLKAIPKLISAVGSIIRSVASAIGSSFAAIGSAIGSLVSKAVQKVRDKVSDFAESGRNLIRGLWQGISDMGEWVWSKISSFCSGIVDKVKGFFGIHSPSTLFAYFGKMLAQGLGIGFVKDMEHISDDMIDAVPTDFDAVFRARTPEAGHPNNDYYYTGLTEQQLKTGLDEVLGKGVSVNANGKNLGRMIKNVVHV